MRNIFLCFLTVILFAPCDLLASGAVRSTSRNETNADSVRVAAPVRTGSNRSNASSTSNRSEKSASRDKGVSARATAISNTAVRNINASGVTSRNADKARSGTNVKQRHMSSYANEMSVIPESMRRANVERSIASRVAISGKDKKVTAQDVADAKDLLEQTANLNKSCQEQYNECMDQFCAVVDANQKRCSCSANLAKYTNVQNAVTNANNELNQVAQRIRYVGLSADEIRAIMTETEAEAELDNTRDTSETRSMLSKIEALIQDPTTKVSMVGDNEFGLDLDLDFSDTTDIFSLDFLNGDNDGISSKRGTALYNAAKKRCKTILNNCTDVGATSTQITGNYDLAIDKDCIAYEQGLKKMNETLQSNVRSAGLMLQKARLAVLQNKNQYDAKGCISALETCMTDDMVCGSDYMKCLDPTKRYIDENGNVVLGQDITNITDFMESFNNAAIDSAKLSSANTITINETTCKSDNNRDGTCVMKHLLNKIGTGSTVKDGGLCRAVLDKCQQYTYNLSGNKYNAFNDVVVNYIQRAMVSIKSAQQRVISDYASSCMTDVASCYNQQVTQVNSWSSVASVSSIKGVMTGACRNVALTCAYAVFANMCTTGEANAMNWVMHVEDPTQLDTTPASCIPCDTEHQSTCIEGISEIFYQSLLCPENSTYNPTCANAENSPVNRLIEGCVNTQCKCNAGYTSWNGSCLSSCASDYYRDEYGTCKSCDTDCSSKASLQDKANTNSGSNNSGSNSGSGTEGGGDTGGNGGTGGDNTGGGNTGGGNTGGGGGTGGDTGGGSLPGSGTSNENPDISGDLTDPALNDIGNIQDP